MSPRKIFQGSGRGSAAAVLRPTASLHPPLSPISRLCYILFFLFLFFPPPWVYKRLCLCIWALSHVVSHRTPFGSSHEYNKSVSLVIFLFDSWLNNHTASSGASIHGLKPKDRDTTLCSRELQTGKTCERAFTGQKGKTHALRAPRPQSGTGQKEKNPCFVGLPGLKSGTGCEG